MSGKRFTLREIGDACALVRAACDRVQRDSGVSLHVDWERSFDVEDVCVRIRAMIWDGRIAQDVFYVSILLVRDSIAPDAILDDMLRARCYKARCVAADLGGLL